MSKYRTFIATALISVIVLGISIVADAQKRTKRRKSKPKAVETYVVAESWEPERGSLFFKQTRQLPDVTRVELRLIRNGKDQVRVLASKILLNDEAKQFTKVWRGLKRGVGAGCFVPAYQLKFYSNDQLLLETDVCFHCHNLTLPNGGLFEHWGFDADGKSGQALLKSLKALLPTNDGLTTHSTGARVSLDVIVNLSVMQLNARPVNSGVIRLRDFRLRFTN